jgi:pyruvate/2-oxoglutarate dehydrogenase complex dihydrolipoamide acyltransferase (E2) component
MRLQAVTLPDLGTGADEPIVVSYWYARRGEEVVEGDRLVEVLVGPATFDVPCPVDGRVAVIRKRAEEQVRPGDVLAMVALAEAPEEPPENPPSPS